MDLKSCMPSTMNPHALAQKIEQVLRSGLLSNNGPVAHDLERAGIPAALGLGEKQKIALVSNGTAALEMAVAYSGAQAWIVPSYTFCATALAPLMRNYRVVLCEVDQNGLIAPDSAMQAIDYLTKLGKAFSECPKTKAIMPVDLFAQDSCAAFERPDIKEMIEKSDGQIQIVVDAAQSFGVHRKKDYPYLRTYSFHATKTIHCCEGGAVQGPEYMIERIRSARAFNLDANQPGFCTYGYSTNEKLDEIRATILRHNLDHAWDVLHHNGHLIDYTYRAILPHQYFMAHAQRYALLKIQDQGLRDQVLAALAKENVHLRTYFEPLHMQARFKDLTIPGMSYANSEALANAFIALPLGWDVMPEQAEKVAWICAGVIGKYCG